METYKELGNRDLGVLKGGGLKSWPGFEKTVFSMLLVPGDLVIYRNRAFCMRHLQTNSNPHRETRTKLYPKIDVSCERVAQNGWPCIVLI